MRTVAAALPLILLLACQSAPTRTYTLYATPAAAKEYTGPALRVESVHMPASMNRSEIMLDVSPEELKINDFDLWSAPLAEMARQTLSQDLIARLPADKVIFPHLSKPSGALGIAVEVLSFRTAGGISQLAASWAILPPPADAAAKGGSVSLSTPNANGGPRQTVQALSILLGQLADRIVAGL